MAVRFDDEELGRAEPADEKAAPVDDDVAQVALEPQLAHGDASCRGERDELAARTRDVHRVGRAVVGDAARVGANGASRELRSGARVEHHDGSRAAKHHVHAPTNVFHEASRLVPSLERRFRHDEELIEVDECDVVALGVGHRRLVPLRDEEQRPPAQCGRGPRGDDDGLVVRTERAAAAAPGRDRASAGIEARKTGSAESAGRGVVAAAGNHKRQNDAGHEMGESHGFLRRPSTSWGLSSRSRAG